VNREALFKTLDEIGIGREELAWILPTRPPRPRGRRGPPRGTLPECRSPSSGKGSPTPHRPGGARRRHEVRRTGPVAVLRRPRARPRGPHFGARGGRPDRSRRPRTRRPRGTGSRPHHAFYHEPDADVVFTADAAGIYVPAVDTVRPTTPPPQFDLDQCLTDLSAIEEIDPEYLCFGHFGPREYEPSLIGEAKRAYVEWVEAVREKRESARRRRGRRRALRGDEPGRRVLESGGARGPTRA